MLGIGEEMSLEGQVAMVTGGGQGIGKAIALRFAQAGADISVLDVNSETAAATGDEIRGMGHRAMLTVADVSDPLAVEAAVKEVVASWAALMCR
jgi:meso-butanediol dehydrogenase / (S,S)-butanediol dehydrogenase / diacetyl reductase